jgi:tRNA 2-thiouridine synthesizing protein A
LRLASDAFGDDIWTKLKGRAMDWTTEVDCSGLLCPLPVLRARKRLMSLPTGAVLAVRATDPMAAVDLPHFCAEAGHAFLESREDGAGRLYLIRKG